MPRSGRRSHHRWRRVTALALVASVVAGACSSGHDTAGPTTTATPVRSTTKPGSTSTPPTTDSGDGTGAAALLTKGIRLSKGTARGATATPTGVVDGTPLDDGAVQAVVDRLPAWTPAGSGAQPFNFPAQTIQRPQSGATVDVPFPSIDQPPPVAVPSGPLHVLRTQPQGDVPIAPFVSVTFDQPMVPVATVGQLAAADVPATITPVIAGHWQWIGPTTLRFDADAEADELDRLPMATDYTVTIPAGTRSANGGVLADAVSWQFSTPSPTVQSFQPTGPSLPLSPIFLATFDQRIDAAAVLATIVVTADGRVAPMQLATAEEIAADASVQQVVDAVPDARWVAFRPVRPFPADTAVGIEIGPGTPSTEGSLTSTDPADYSAHTFEPLRIENVGCGYGDGCVPGSEIDITFNNAIDAKSFDPAFVVVEPVVADAAIGVSGNVLAIRGVTTGNTTYHVTIPGALTDTFGQQLGKADTRRVDVGAPRPLLQQFGLPLTTLDPSADHPSVSVVSIGHHRLRVRVFRADPNDWSGYMQSAGQITYGDPSRRPAAPPWTKLTDATVDVAGGENSVAVTAIDLSEQLPNGLGHVIVIVEPTETYGTDSPDYWNNRPTITWVQSTHIGLDALADADELRTWATDLGSGAPLTDVAVQLSGTATTATTDADGLAALVLPGSSPPAVVATKGDDVALLPNLYGGGWQRTDVLDNSLWYVFDDRQVYRPTETVSIKGWVRRLTTSGDVQLQLWAATSVAFTARDSQGNVIGSGDAKVNPLGGFDLTFTIPAGANLGAGSVELDLADGAGAPNSFVHQYHIEKFRRPEFEVTTRADSAGPYLRGAPATLAVDADYYAGGPLGAAPVSWEVTAAAASYAPPGWDGFGFGRWTPWWSRTDSFAGATDSVCCNPPGPEADVHTYSGTTDASGSDYLQVDVGALDDDLAGLPVSVSAQASVQDVNGQAWASTTSLLLHPADFYVGLRSDRTFVRRGDPLSIDTIVTDIDGMAVAGRTVEATATRTESVFTNGAWTDKQVDPQTCTTTSTTAPMSCVFTTAVGGTYTINATVTDDGGRSSRSELTRWVSAAESVPTRTVDKDALTIVPDKQEHQPGDTAELLVQAPFATGDGLLTVSRGGIVSTNRFDVVDGSAIVRIPITDHDVPNIDASIEVVGSAPRTADDGSPLPDAPQRPAYAAGDVTLPVSTTSRALTVTATPHDAQLQPGASTQVDVGVTDAAGQPVAGGELAVVVVDEAVLALSDYQLQDPLAAFYAQLPSQLTAQFGRQSIVLVDPSSFLLGVANGDTKSSATTVASGTTAAGGASGTVPASADSSGRSAAPTSAAAPQLGGGTGATTPIDVRTNFDALAVFAPAVTTDASGHALIDVPLPDNLTRYRVMVVAVSGVDRFGSGEANITARLPLMVRPSAPRFLNFGDTFELPVVVQNQTDAAMDVDVVVQTANLTPASASGKRVSVPANDRVEVRFPMSAAEAGTASMRVSAASRAVADSATVDVPVYTPATADAFATYGVLDDGAVAQPVAIPTGVIPQFGGLDISTSSTSLQALTDAVIYLTDYPYDSSDALASRILSIAALRPVLAAFAAPDLPGAGDLDAAVDRDVALLVALQNDDGGFAYWQRSARSEPFNSLQAAQALVAARDAGYTVPRPAIDRALAFAVDIESHIPAEYGQNARDTISAYAVNVRMRAGDRDSVKAKALFDRHGELLPLDAVAWLWPVIDDPATSTTIGRLLANRAVDTAGAVTFTTAVDDGASVTLSSDRRTDGLLLDALIAVEPKSDLIPKVVNGLLAAQTQGRWDNVQENAFILLALKRYFDSYESQTPDFVARVWLGDRYAGEQPFSGRSTDRDLLTVPTAQLLDTGDADLTISKEGTGRLYYRIGLRTAPADLHLEPLDRGFVVARTYEGVDDPADVTRDADGTWHVKAGARVRVRLTMVAESQRTHVALVDPLPAGLEILNPALTVSQDSPPDHGSAPTTTSGVEPSVTNQSGHNAGTSIARAFGPWYPTWFDHQNLRDDRAEAFATLLPAGTYDYGYMARATTPGTFVTPPPRAEEIYAPETFGRGRTDTVVIGG